ncbi:uncharacterized protein LOC144350661 [Saccoglossus kowalevskii]
MRDKTSTSIAWMRFYFERMGDYMPHNTKVVLPCSWTKIMVYERMINEFEQRGFCRQDTICYDYFCRMWTTHLSEFTIGKGNEFVACSTCVQLDEQYQKAKSAVERNRIRALVILHNHQVEKERKRFHYHREKAEKEPDEILTIIQDGMDQNKTDLPHLIKEDKGTSNLHRLRSHVTGNIVHTGVTSGKLPYVYIDFNQVPHDSNLTLNVLLEVLVAAKNHLAKVLYLQLDNCFRENKNRYVLSFMSLLVELDIFEEVYVNFLPVGHTHENVDQMFSKISTGLRKDNAYTVEDLISIIKNAYTPAINVAVLGPLLNIKEWLIPHLYGNFNGHSKPHNFRFRKVDQKTYMHYRLWSSDPWEPQCTSEDDVPGLICFKSTPCIDDPPEWVVPSLMKLDVEALERSIPNGFVHRMPSHAVQSWKDFMSNIKDLEKTPVDVPERWQLHDLVEAAEAKQQLRQNSEDLDAMPENIRRIEQNLNRACNPIIIGNQGKKVVPEVQEMDDFISVKDGMLVAVWAPDNDARPQIAQVIARTDSKLKIHWFVGTYTGVWKSAYHGVGANRNAWEDEVEVESCILWDFAFTKSNKLKKGTSENLKKKYAELDKFNASDSD